MRLRRIAFALATLFAACSGGDTRVYQFNDLQLLTSYGAKELCSCLFVMEQSDEFCAAWTVASPNVKTVRVDRGAKSVQTQAGLFWGARAHWVSEHDGCVLE